ncbi:hypothetical protein NUSPORA_02308 [Nucleospora cyclopteri]
MLSIFNLNVNGLRSFSKSLGKDFNQWLLDTGYDIYCFQEIKGSKENLQQFHTLRNFVTISSFHQMNGRHGVSTMIKKGIVINKISNENSELSKKPPKELVKGRILKTFHGNFTIYNVYMPFCSVNDENADVMKTYETLEKDLRNDQNSSIKIVCGDLNATYAISDHYLYQKEYEKLVISDEWSDKIKYETSLNTESNSKGVNLFSGTFYKKLLEATENNKTVDKISPKQTELPFYFLKPIFLEEFFFQTPQRRWFKELMKTAVDTFIVVNKELYRYSCWDVKLNLRERNWGTRIDYILIYGAAEMKKVVIESDIISDFTGSDHAPVIVKLNIDVIKSREKIKNSLFDYFSIIKT